MSLTTGTDIWEAGPGATGIVHYGPSNAGVTLFDYGGGMQDNLLRAGLFKLWGNNPYFPQYGTAPASTINKQSSLGAIQRNRLAEGNPIPIVYGTAQVGGMLFAIDYTAGVWTLGYIICLGEIGGYNSVLINGETATIDINYYTGTTGQTADPLLAAAISGYADTMVISDPAGDVGIAYIVIQYTDEDYDSWPSVIVEIQGKKVWNPKTSTTVYSSNPALHLGDLLRSPVYGLNQPVDNTALETAQDYCDDATLGEVRRTSYTVIDSKQDTQSWLEILRTYASCGVIYRAGVAYLAPDKAGSSIMTIGPEDIERDSLRITKKDSSDIPTVIRAYYTDTVSDPWRERLCDPAKAAGVDAGTTQWRESRIRLNGITRHSQAYRECIERLNKFALSDLEVSWIQFDDALDLESGDIVTLSHPYGLASKLLRIVDEPIQVSPGRWSVRGLEYDPAAYSNEIASAPTYGDGNLPSGGVPDAPTGLTIGEAGYQTQNGEYASRITIAWTAPSTIVSGYNVEVREGTVLVWSVNTTSTNATTSPLKEGVLYTVKAKAYNSLYTGTEATVDYTIVGKTAIPGPVTGLTGFEAGGEVRLWWVGPSAASDYDVRRYEVRYYTTSETWADGTVIDQVDSLRIVTKDVPAGTWRFGVKSIDSIRQYSTAATEIDLAVTLDQDAFRAGNLDPITTHASLTLMYTDLIHDTGITEYYSDGSDTWSSLFASAMSTYTNSLASYQSAAGTSYWYSEELDMLQDQSGTFRALVDYTDHSGTAVVELGLKPDAGAYAWDSNLSQQGMARYLQVRIRSTGIFQVNTPQGYIHADIVAREEVGTAATSGSPAKATVTLDNPYGSARSISIVAQGTAARICTYDNIVLGATTTFDIYTFDAAGASATATVRYVWKGV